MALVTVLAVACTGRTVPAQKLRDVDHVVHLQATANQGGFLLVARPPFHDQTLLGARVHFRVADLLLAVPFTTDASGQWRLPYPKGTKLNVVVQAMWMETSGIKTSNALHLRQNLYKSWANSPSDDKSHWPIGVWLQNPSNASKYKALGINLYVGLWKGPTSTQLSSLGSQGMPAFSSQNTVGLTSSQNSTLEGWLQQDEPDNAQWNSSANRYDPPVLPSVIQSRYTTMKSLDKSRPVFLNFGAGMADEKWGGRGTRTGHLEDYPEYIKGADILSFDFYPVAGPSRTELQGHLEVVGNGVRRLVGWAQEKPVWNFIEAAGVKNGTRPTQTQIRSEVWMSIINGAVGTMYFVHEFTPSFIEATPLQDPKLASALTTINDRLRKLAPVLNSASVRGDVTITAPRRIEFLHKVLAGKDYLLAVNMDPQSCTAGILLNGLDKAPVQVLDESRSLSLVKGAMTDTFGPYQVHLYQIGN